MPAEVITTERYCVYSTDGSNDDNKSVCSERNSFIFRDQDCTDLSDVHTINGKVMSCSPVHSSTTLDKWGSYWSTRERCCCFWNFVLSASLIVTVTIVVLATKGVVFSNLLNMNRSWTTDDKGLPGYIAPINIQCETTSPVPKVALPLYCACPSFPTNVLLVPFYQTYHYLLNKKCMDSECLRSSVEILSKMNLSVDPCHDFYSYACGGFMDKVRLSWNSPRKRTNPDIIIDDYYDVVLDSLSEDIQKSDSNRVKIIKTVYKSCIERKDTPLTKLSTVIDSLGGFELGSYRRTRQLDLTTLLSEVIIKYGTFPLFNIDVSKDGQIAIYNKYSDEGVARRHKNGKTVHRYKFLKPSHFLYRNEETDLVLQAYKSYIEDFLAFIMGINDTVKNDQLFISMVDDIYHLNVFMNRVFYTEDMTNFSEGLSKCKNQFSLDWLQSQYAYNISWKDVFSTLFKDTPFSNNFTICTVSLTSALSDVLSGFTFTTLKRFIIFQVLTSSDISHLLPVKTPTFDEFSWNYGANDALNGKMSSEKYLDNDCLRQISQHLPMYFVIFNHSSEQFNDTLMRLFTDLISSIERIIRQLYWIPTKQKQYLLTELQGLTLRFEWQKTIEYSMLIYMQNVSSDDYFENMRLMINFSTKRYFSGHHRSVTGEKSSIFHLRDKELEIPMSVTQVPLVYASLFPSLFLGSLGTYISQAISELFDIEALLRYLTEEKIDHKVALTIAFRLQCLLDEYNRYTLPTSDGNNEKIRGDLTKSANFKDSLALKVVYKTYSQMKKTETVYIPGLDLTQDQLFFLSYAQSMCEKTNLKGTRYYYIDSTTTHHSPGKYRVIGTLSHFKKFSEAFDCPPSAQMNPKNKCTFL